MNKKFFLIALFAACIGSISADTEISSEHQPSLVEILKTILNDPEFSTLDVHDQMKIMEALYVVIDIHFKNMSPPEQQQTTTNKPVTMTSIR